MTINSETTMDQIHTADMPAHGQRIRNSALSVGRFLLHLLEMLLSMAAGMVILFLLEDKIPASSPYSAIFEDELLYNLAHAVFMTVPMVAWMIVRGHGWRHSAEMAFAMLAPVAASIVLSLLGADAYLPWLDDAGHLAMFLGMILAMLYRRDHYTGKAGHSPHATHREIS